MKDEQEKEFVCRHCSIFLNREDLLDGNCPNCDNDDSLFLNDLLDL